MRRLIIPILAIVAAATTVTAHRPSVADAPAPTTSTQPAPTTTMPTVNHRTLMETGVTVPPTTTTTIPAGNWRHPQWIALAVQVGWPNDPNVLATLDLIIQRESNGRPEAWNQADPHTGSYGLAQINGYWCIPTKYNANGFMQAQNIGVTVCADLFDPATNLRAALVIWTRQDGFGAWSTV